MSRMPLIPMPEMANPFNLPLVGVGSMALGEGCAILPDAHALPFLSALRSPQMGKGRFRSQGCMAILYV